jgi:hypothetical protein
VNGDLFTSASIVPPDPHLSQWSDDIEFCEHSHSIQIPSGTMIERYRSPKVRFANTKERPRTAFVTREEMIFSRAKDRPRTAFPTFPGKS